MTELDDIIERLRGHHAAVNDLLNYVDALEGRVEELKDALADLLLAGEHPGPCDNEETDDSCSLHLAAAERRAARAQVVLSSDNRDA